MSNLKDQKLQEELRRREYLKQQQQLRNMTKPKTNLSADAMIENLLSKKEIFQKKSPNSAPPNQNMVIPPMYQAIWNWCKVPGSAEFADTNKISSLLMTSRLPTDALGYIWSLSNQSVPGSLTQQELFYTLALVALAQSGYSFRSIAVINQLGRFPIPVLDMSLVGPAAPLPSSSSAKIVSPLSQTPISPPANALPPRPFSQSFPPSQAPPPEDDDEFDDFKSADLSTLNVENLKVLEMASTKSSLIRFDSPKRPPPVLSILESPTKEPPSALTVLDMPLVDESNTGRRTSPEQLSVLDLPLTETCHQPPFDTAVTCPPTSSANSTATITPVEPPAPIHSISGSVDSPTHSTDSPTHGSGSPTQVDDLFPKCVVKKNQPSNLLEWDATPPNEEYLSCDLVSNKIELNPAQSQPEIVDLKMITPDISLGLSNLKLDSAPQSLDTFVHQPAENKTPKFDADFEFDSFKMSESLPVTDSSTSGELSLSEFEAKLPDDVASGNAIPIKLSPNINTGNSFLDIDDKYSALRGLEPKVSDEFGDFIMAEPSNLLSDPPLVPPTSIQEQCLEAVFGLLQQAINSFKNINDEKVLIEVLDDPRCKKYLEELGEVYNVGERLSKISEMKAKRYELDNLWSSLAAVTRQALPQTRKIHSEGGELVRCGVCLQESGSSCQIGYAMNYFHPACANLYLNRVSGASLPLQ